MSFYDWQIHDESWVSSLALESGNRGEKRYCVPILLVNEHSIAKWIAAEEARAKLRHAVVYPNVTGNLRKGWPKASGLVLVCSPVLTSQK